MTTAFDTATAVRDQLTDFTVTPSRWGFGFEAINPATNHMLRVTMDDTEVELYFFDIAHGPLCGSAKFTGIGANLIAALIANYLNNGR